MILCNQSISSGIAQVRNPFSSFSSSAAVASNLTGAEVLALSRHQDAAASIGGLAGNYPITGFASQISNNTNASYLQQMLSSSGILEAIRRKQEEEQNMVVRERAIQQLQRTSQTAPNAMSMDSTTDTIQLLLNEYKRSNQIREALEDRLANENLMRNRQDSLQTSYLDGSNVQQRDLDSLSRYNRGIIATDAERTFLNENTNHPVESRRTVSATHPEVMAAALEGLGQKHQHQRHPTRQEPEQRNERNMSSLPTPSSSIHHGDAVSKQAYYLNQFQNQLANRRLSNEPVVNSSPQINSRLNLPLSSSMPHSYNINDSINNNIGSDGNSEMVNQFRRQAATSARSNQMNSMLDMMRNNQNR